MLLEKLEKEYGPDFACVGFPKCATTFILKRFEEYSFDTLVQGEFPIHQLEEYREKIKDIHSEGKKIAIKNPTTIYKREFVDNLQRSGCKIIISVRNPVRWIKSFYNYRLQRIEDGLETVPPAFTSIPSFSDIVTHDINFMGVSIKRGMMSKIITRSLLNSQYFDASRVLFVIQEEFESQHDKVQNELLDFLEIPVASRKERKYQFEYNKTDRWNQFNDNSSDEYLYRIYGQEIKDICTLIKDQTGKDLKTLWENFYSIQID